MAANQRPSVPFDGPLAPPRRNGEIVFDAPWESRVFGIAALLQEQGRWTWEQFSACFGEASAGGVPEYYHQWLSALESLLIEQGVLSDSELDARAEQFATGLFDHH